jgi:hypothetical protein
VNLEAPELVRRYLAGELDLESAAKGIHMSGEFGLYYSHDVTTAEDRERLETLFGRVLWLSLREGSPDSVPDEPFGAAEFRDIAKGVFFDASGEVPDQIKDSDPSGNA